MVILICFGISLILLKDGYNDISESVNHYLKCRNIIEKEQFKGLIMLVLTPILFMMSAILFGLRATNVALVGLVSVSMTLVVVSWYLGYCKQSIYIRSYCDFLAHQSSLFVVWKKCYIAMQHALVTQSRSCNDAVKDVRKYLEEGIQPIDAFEHLSPHYLTRMYASIVTMAETEGTQGLEQSLAMFDEALESWRVHIFLHQEATINVRWRVVFLSLMSLVITFLSINMLKSTHNIVIHPLYQQSVTYYLVLMNCIIFMVFKKIGKPWIRREECL